MSEQTLIEAEILRLTGLCGPTKSVSPTDVAHAVVPDGTDAWRHKLTAVRRAAIRLTESGQIDILRKGKPIVPADMKGVIRLRIRLPGAAPAIQPGDDGAGEDHAA